MTELSKVIRRRRILQLLVDYYRFFLVQILCNPILLVISYQHRSIKYISTGHSTIQWSSEANDASDPQNVPPPEFTSSGLFIGPELWQKFRLCELSASPVPWLRSCTFDANHEEVPRERFTRDNRPTSLPLVHKSFRSSPFMPRAVSNALRAIYFRQWPLAGACANFENDWEQLFNVFFFFFFENRAFWEG